ncbi:TonB-dependent receptor plug domain-containing protein [Pseudoduganella sp. UC29_106]|uniref:TonB-dependent receptor plug domain-containing protein n=1 Tax=Pseudoduganella sp. UC29_106 TaxID=3374553 RepID=UPI0037569232
MCSLVLPQDHAGDCPDGLLFAIDAGRPRSGIRPGQPGARCRNARADPGSHRDGAKRKENLREAAVSAAVVTADSLVKSGVETLDDVGKAVPSLVAAPSGGNLRSGFTMRGISTSVVTVGAPSGTAVMIDGVTLAPESMAAKQLTDIQNLEVLRGPQATLGGRTASSGVVNIVTRAPEDSFSGRVGATADQRWPAPGGRLCYRPHQRQAEIQRVRLRWQDRVPDPQPEHR